MSDRDNGITPAACQVFSAAQQSHYSYHIKRNVIAEYNTHFNDLVLELAKEADAARVQESFDEIGRKDEDACEYIEGIGSPLWITASFSVPRYGIVTANAAEAVNSSLGDLGELLTLKKYPFWYHAESNHENAHP